MGEPRAFTKKVGEPVTIGRGPKNTVVLTNTAVSGQHVKLQAVAGKKLLSVTDLSTNGVGYRTSPTGPLTRLEKGADAEIQVGNFYLALPYKVKAKDEATAESMRVQLHIQIDGCEAVPAAAPSVQEDEAVVVVEEKKKKKDKKEKEKDKEKEKADEEAEKREKEKEKEKEKKKDKDSDDEEKEAEEAMKKKMRPLLKACASNC